MHAAAVVGNSPRSSAWAASQRCRVHSGLLPSCEPTAHRFVRRVILPPPHHPHECRPEPTLSTPAGVGSSRHGPSGASPGSGDRGRWWGSPVRVSPPLPAVSRVATRSVSRTQPAEQRERTSAGPSRTAVASATKRSDALSVRTYHAQTRPSRPWVFVRFLWLACQGRRTITTALRWSSPGGALHYRCQRL